MSMATVSGHFAHEEAWRSPMTLPRVARKCITVPALNMANLAHHLGLKSPHHPSALAPMWHISCVPFRDRSEEFLK
jgi:hypothetical protein